MANIIMSTERRREARRLKSSALRGGHRLRLAGSRRPVDERLEERLRPLAVLLEQAQGAIVPSLLERDEDALMLGEDLGRDHALVGLQPHLAVGQHAVGVDGVPELSDEAHEPWVLAALE